MNPRSFILGLVASFGIAWSLVVVAPFLSLRSLPAMPLDEAPEGQPGFYHPKRAGRTLDGALVYAANGCNQCHTQLIRPTYAGAEVFRPDWAGLSSDLDRGDTRRETNAYDFQGERHALIGVVRIGPDLGNLGRRLDARFGSANGPSAEQWLMRHLYDPRLDPERAGSVCPPHQYLFKSEPIRGVRSSEALDIPGTRSVRQIIPTAEARALVDYLRNLRKDQNAPSARSSK
jgi:cytochrome c oxidase cbb3-type subunit 2